MAVHELFAYLCVDGADAAIRFYGDAFGATAKFRLVEPGGRVGHAELDFDGATLMLADEFPEIGVRGPGNLGGSPVTIHLHCGRLRRRGRACGGGRRDGGDAAHRPSSTASGRQSSTTRSGTAGTSGTRSRKSPRARCSGVSTRWSRAADRPEHGPPRRLRVDFLEHAAHPSGPGAGDPRPVP